jgi:hypothetical protein
MSPANFEIKWRMEQEQKVAYRLECWNMVSVNLNPSSVY